MHIPDKILSPAVWALMDVAAVGMVGYAVRQTQRKLEPRDVPLMGVMCAFIFAGQMINFPVAPMVSGHLIGASLVAILLGLGPAVLVMSTVLVVQCFLFSDGGVLALGANLVNMAVLAPLAACAVYGLVARQSEDIRTHTRAAWLAAWVSVLASAGGACLQLTLSGYSVALAPPALLWHALIGVGESLITVAALRLVWSTRPDLKPARAIAEART